MNNEQNEKYEGGILTPLANWLVEQRVHYADSGLYTMQIRAHRHDSYALEVLGITAETASNSVLDLVFGYIDMLNTGEGIRLFVDNQASWGEAFKGGGRDLLRVVSIFPGLGAVIGRVKKFKPIGRFLQPSQNAGQLRQMASNVEQRLRNIHQQIAERLPNQNSNFAYGSCVENALQRALVQTGRYIYIPFKSICNRLNKHFPYGVSQINQVKTFLNGLGVNARLVGQVTRKNAQQVLKSQGEDGVLIFGLTYEYASHLNPGKTEMGSHLLYAFLDKTGKLKFMDRTGVADDLVKLLKESYSMTKGRYFKGQIFYRREALFVPNAKVLPDLAKGTVPHLLTLLAVGTKELVLDTGVFEREFEFQLKQSLGSAQQQFPGKLPHTTRCY